MSVADNYPPTKALLMKLLKDFKERLHKKELTLTDDVAKDMVNEVWNNA